MPTIVSSNSLGGTFPSSDAGKAVSKATSPSLWSRSAYARSGPFCNVVKKEGGEEEEIKLEGGKEKKGWEWGIKSGWYVTSSN